MFRIIKILCLTPFILYAVPSLALTTSPDGSTGNLTSQTSDTLSSDEMVSYGFIGLDDFYSKPDWQHEMNVSTGFYMGLSNRAEAGMGLSLANNSANIATGNSARYLKAYAKFRFYGSRSFGSAASVYFYSTTGEIPDNTSLASGKTNSGLQLTYSNYYPDSETTYALNMDTRDYKVYNSGSFNYELVPILSLSASRMFYTRYDRMYELGLTAQSATLSGTSNGNLYVVMAAHFNTNNRMKYSAGTVLDTGNGAGTLLARYFVGFSYNNSFGNRKRPARDVVEAEQQVPAKTSVETEKKPAMVKEPEQAPPILTTTCHGNVEIMDMSGIEGLGEKVASKLRRQGYCVPSVYTESRAMSYYSQIYYADGKALLARKLSKAFSIQGNIAERTLPTGVAVRFVVGRDQE